MFDWMVEFVRDTGYVGVFLLMLAENLFPPIPSELIMPLAGFNAARGELSLVGVIFAGTLGALAGAFFWYGIGRAFGYARVRWLTERFGRWMTMSPEDLDRARAVFDRHAGKAVFFGRLLPAIRTLISIPAGVSAMSPLAFAFWTTLGTVIWTTFLTVAGYLLESQYEAVSAYVDPVSNVVVVVIVLIYIYRVVTFRARP
jgi:membrane protein DedA with SNARE-associated domain